MAGILWLALAGTAFAALTGCVSVDPVKSRKEIQAEKHVFTIGELNSFVFSPDGQTLAFTRRYQGRRVVGFMGVESGRFVQLEATGAHLAKPAFSPDGGTLALEYSIEGDPETHRLALLDMKTMRYQFLTAAEGILQFRPAPTDRQHDRETAENTPRYCPVFSPDGARLLYSRPFFWTWKGGDQGRAIDPFEIVFFGATMLPIMLAITPIQVLTGDAKIVPFKTDDNAEIKPKMVTSSVWEIWEMDIQSGKERRIGDYKNLSHSLGCPKYYGDDKMLFSRYISPSNPPKEGASYESGDYVAYLADIRNPVPDKELEPAITRGDFPSDMEVDQVTHPSPARDGSVLLSIADDEHRSGLALWNGKETRILKNERVRPYIWGYTSLALSPDARLAAYRSGHRTEYWLMDVASLERWNFDIPPQEEWEVVQIAEE